MENNTSNIGVSSDYKKEIKEIINKFCKEIELFSAMYFNKWNIILEEDIHMSYYIENWCKKARLENIDALFRNLGIKCRFYEGDFTIDFVYDTSEEFHAKNALVVNLEDIHDIETMQRYLSYINEYTDKFYECIVTINNIPSKITRYPADYSISLDVIPIMHNMKNIIDSLAKYKVSL